jgi:hypothetical protein
MPPEVRKGQTGSQRDNKAGPALMQTEFRPLRTPAVSIGLEDDLDPCALGKSLPVWCRQSYIG